MAGLDGEVSYASQGRVFDIATGADVTIPVLRLLPLLLAPFVGSFLGVVIRRLPVGRPMVIARSVCEACGRTLGPAELVPLVSFVALRGRCRGCHAIIPRFHPLIELAALAVADVAVLAGGDAVHVWAGCVLGWTLLTLGWIDAVHLVLPDELTLPLLLAGLAVTALQEPEELTDRSAAAVLGYLAFRMLSILFRWLRGREGLGHGDAKLLAAGGAWLGVAALGRVVLIGALTGLVMAGLLRLRGHDVRGELPFGPALAAAIWACWIVGW